MSLGVLTEDALQGSIVLGGHKVDLDVAINEPLDSEPPGLYAELISDFLRYNDLTLRSDNAHLDMTP